MPTELVSGAVAVFPDAGTQAFDFRDQHVSIQIHKVFIHAGNPSDGIVPRVESLRAGYGDRCQPDQFGFGTNLS